MTWLLWILFNSTTGVLDMCDLTHLVASFRCYLSFTNVTHCRARRYSLNSLQHSTAHPATHCNTPCNTLQHTLQHALQHTITHGNTPWCSTWLIALLATQQHTWLFHKCDVTHFVASNRCYVFFLNWMTWLIFNSMTRPIDMCDVAHLVASFRYNVYSKTCHFVVCDVTHWTRFNALQHTRQHTATHLQHTLQHTITHGNTPWCSTWLIVMCDVTHRIPDTIDRVALFFLTLPRTGPVTHWYAGRDSLVCPTWLMSLHRPFNTATRCTTLQRTAMHRTTLHHTATHCHVSHCHVSLCRSVKQ